MDIYSVSGTRISEQEAKDPVAAMQAKYPELKKCAALVKLGLTAADTVSQSCAVLVYFLIFDKAMGD